jgi:large subunit ribosomal protein L4e
MRQTNVYLINGKTSKKADVPDVFDTPYRPDIIRRAVTATASNSRQPYGPSPDAGTKHSVSTWGKGRGVARVQRLKAGRKATESPNNVSGRRAHPPLPDRIWDLKVNRKERVLARFSAIAATGDADVVRTRGHQFEDTVTFPIIVEDKIQDLGTTAEVVEVLENIGLGYDLDRAKDGRKIRAGKGKMRNRKYRTPVSILLVVSDKEKAVFQAASNLPGVEVAAVGGLNASILAPGGDAGRLTVFSESALTKIGEWSL